MNGRGFLLLMFAASLLAGCAMFGSMFGPKPVKPDWDSLTLMAAADANANTALAVDVVFVKDKELLTNLLAMPAAKYFAATDSLQRSFPDGLTVLSREVVPGQNLVLGRAEFKNEKAWAVLAFANYGGAPGDYRVRLPLDQDRCVLRLEAQSFTGCTATH